jgi:hypothetical protein
MVRVFFFKIKIEKLYIKVMVYLFASHSSDVWSLQCVPNAINKTNPYFVWYLTSLATNATYSVFQLDSSPSNYFYSQFTMSLYQQSATGGGLASFGLQAGQYSFIVYETDIPYSTDINLNDNIVNQGLMMIIGTVSHITELYTTETPQTIFYDNLQN